MYPFGYNLLMFEIKQTDVFERWLKRLKDPRGLARILIRIEALRQGHSVDVKAISKNLYELRVHLSPGYRIYFTYLGRDLVLLLSCGDKGSQSRDIARAKRLLAELNHAEPTP